MMTLQLHEKKITMRVGQLKKYRQLETCVKGAKTILKFAQEYNLKGDFEQIRIIATVSDLFNMFKTVAITKHIKVIIKI